MADRVIKLEGRGARGPSGSFVGDARASGQFGILPGDTDTEALAKFAAYLIENNAGLQGPAGAGVDARTTIDWYGNSLVEGIGYTPSTALLEAALNAAGDKFTVTNKGRSGETAKQIRARVEADAAAGLIGKYAIFGPDAVNSIRVGQNDTQVKAELTAMYAAAKGAGATVIVLTDTPWKGYVDGNPSFSWDVTKQGYTDAVNAWKVAIPANVDHVIDLYPEFEHASAADTLKAIYDDGGHLHYPQAGYNKIRDMVVAAISFAQDAGLSARVDGASARLNQDVSSEGSPEFQNLAVGARQGGFGPPYTILSVTYSEADGTRRIGFGALPGSDSRDITIDGVWKQTWRSIDRSVNDGRQARIGIPVTHYGVGYGYLALETADGVNADLKQGILVTSKQRVVVGEFDDPLRKFVVGHTDGVRMEVGVSNENPADPAGAVSTLYINRISGNYATHWQNAAQFWFLASGGGVMHLDASEVTFYKPIVGTGLKISSLPTYADDAAAGVGGLTADSIYKTPAGALMVKG